LTVKDPFAPARRSLITGPLFALAGGALVYFGVAGEGLSWLLCIPGGLLVLHGLLRVTIASFYLLHERKRVRILRDGEQATAKVVSASRTGEKMGYPIYELELEATRADGTSTTLSSHGAIPVQYDGSIDPGEELPVRLESGGGSRFAVEWDWL
jgi:hypothetical protein